jgi:hypothetical protein
VSDLESDQIVLRPVGGNRPPGRAWLAVAAVGVLFAGIVLVGRFGGRGVGPAPTAVTQAVAAPPSAVATMSRTPPGTVAPTSVAVESTAPSGAPPSPASRARLLRPRLGYALVRSAPAETVIELDDHRTISLVYSRTNLPPQLGGGTIEIALGTPALGANVHGLRWVSVFGSSLTTLEAAYRRAVPATLPFSLGMSLGGEPGTLLEVRDMSAQRGRAPATILIALHGGRAFVITASGFDAGTAAASTQARQRALEDFANRFEFIGPPFFASEALGFEVPGVAADAPTVAGIGGAGSVVFPAGSLAAGRSYTHSIHVDVGMLGRPAFPPIEPLPAVSAPGIWAADQDALERTFLKTYGAGRSALRTTVGGQRALRVDAPGLVGAAVVVAYRGRSYIISTTGLPVAEVAPGFEEFLADFRFIDPSGA